jgi:acetoacetyl-CoA synthetase
MFPRPTFFQGAKLNFAENLLYPKCITDEDSLAVIASTEVARENVTWKQLRERVRQCTDALKSIGVGEGDRVAGYVANHTNALVAMLAATSMGAIWTGISPDTGVFAVLDRVQQIQPVVLFSDNAVIYNGKTHGVQEKLQEIVLGLSSLAALIVFPSVPDHNLDFDLFKPAQIQTWNFADFLSHTPSTAPNTKQCFAQFSPDHPVYILYSSGTTGKPKAIVHSAAGTLLQHKKEHDIHCDIRPGSRLFYFTTTTWMMWHWLLSGLASGATLILYDGSPFRSLNNSNTDDLAMPRLINDLSITHFGTSAKYLSILEQKNVSPDPMPSLQAIYSTGSPLAPSTFAYVYRAFGPNINLASITGGTDIISLFGAPSPISPVYAGEIQIRALGMDVLVYDFAGKDITLTGEAGDLVCVKPFPCQPIYFWGPEGNAKYKKSYFDTFPGIWHHGDFVRINPKTGGMFMLGRSDGTLKPSGVRFGSAEIYNIVLQDFPEVDDALCIGRRRETDVDETVVLFLKMVEGQKFDEGLAKRIKGVVREKLSARHVPAIVDECPEIPVTMNGKK